jgi:hypothetical protein
MQWMKVDGLPEDEIETSSIRRICSGKHAGATPVDSSGSSLSLGCHSMPAETK